VKTLPAAWVVALAAATAPASAAPICVGRRME